MKGDRRNSFNGLCSLVDEDYIKFLVAQLTTSGRVAGCEYDLRFVEDRRDDTAFAFSEPAEIRAQLILDTKQNE